MISQFKYDYFFHYLFTYSHEMRRFLCQYISGDDSIQNTYVKNSETFKGSYLNKKLILDVVVEDVHGRLYDFEMNNYDIQLEDKIRFLRYSERLIDYQEKVGVEYIHLKNVYQLIIYTGKPIQNLSHYYHVIQKGDIDKRIRYSGEKVKTVLLQLQLLKEAFDMEKPLPEMEQLGYLFTYDQPHPNSEESDLVKEVMNMHQQYMINEDGLLKSYDIERERNIIACKMERNREEGKQIGKMETLLQTVISLLKNALGKLTPELTLKIEESNEEELNNIVLRIFDIHSENDVYQILQ